LVFKANSVKRQQIIIFFETSLERRDKFSETDTQKVGRIIKTLVTYPRSQSEETRYLKRYIT
jgi:hypothetical protein